MWVAATWAKLFGDKATKEGKIPAEVMDDFVEDVTFGNDCAKCFVPTPYTFDRLWKEGGEKAGGPLGRNFVGKALLTKSAYDLAKCLAECRGEDPLSCSVFD